MSETWVAALSCFDRQIVVDVLVGLSLNEDRDTNLGKIAMACERLKRERNGTLGQGDVKLSTKTLKAVAAAWEVSN